MHSTPVNENRRGSFDETLLRVADVAALLQVSERQVQRLCELRRLKHIRLGRHLRFRRQWIEDFIERGESWQD